MKQISIVVRPIRAEAVLKELTAMEVTSCIVREAKGYSRQKGYLDRYVGSEYSDVFLPKVEILCAVQDHRVDEVVERILPLARTGRMGDGKILIMSMGWPEAIEF